MTDTESEFRNAERWNHLLVGFYEDCEFGTSTKESSVFRRAKKDLMTTTRNMRMTSATLSIIICC